MFEKRTIKGEKRMSKLVKHLLAGCAALALANVAMADRLIGNVATSVGNMQISETVVPGTGNLAGFDIHRFFAAFSATDLQGLATAQGLQSAKVTLSTNANFKYVQGQFAAPGNATNPDVDVTGTNASDATYRTATSQGNVANFEEAIGTGIFIHDPSDPPDVFSVQGVAVDNVGKTSTAFNSSSATAGGTALFGPAKSFRIEGFVQNPLVPDATNPVGADPAAKTANKGQIGAGALFAMAIVPTGSSVDAAGILAADKGPTTEFATPEPGTLGFIGLAATTLLARRRRNA